MQIETCVNVSNEALFGNISINSRRLLNWVKDIAEHDGHAVIVGGGPSVKDWLDEIKWRQSAGQTIFALNGAAKMLHEHGIKIDHQIILDAREQNIEFIGYAKHYYLASQCHPSVFDKIAEDMFSISNVTESMIPKSFVKCKAITLWHQHYPEDMEQFDASLPPDCPDCTLVGGGTTVGLSAMTLAYILGYRRLHLYGYDSSYADGNSHAYAQTDNQSVDCEVTVAGRTFQTSLAMAQQAELFPQISDLLLDLGCTITLRGDGLLPHTSKMSSVPSEPLEFTSEADKYSHMWNLDAYSEYSPGEHAVSTFMEVVKPDQDWWIADLGCGTGRGGLEISKHGNRVLLVDFTENSRDKAASGFPFLKWDLTGSWLPIKVDCGFCTDVMEHIPPHQVGTVIANIMLSMSRAFFQICLVQDHFGAAIGQPLHLTVESFGWWKEKIESLGFHIEWSRDDGENALFYVTCRPLGKE